MQVLVAGNAKKTQKEGKEEEKEEGEPNDDDDDRKILLETCLEIERRASLSSDQDIGKAKNAWSGTSKRLNNSRRKNRL